MTGRLRMRPAKPAVSAAMARTPSPSQPQVLVRIAAVYAPIPQKAAWPKDI